MWGTCSLGDSFPYLARTPSDIRGVKCFCGGFNSAMFVGGFLCFWHAGVRDVMRGLNLVCFWGDTRGVRGLDAWTQLAVCVDSLG